MHCVRRLVLAAAFAFAGSCGSGLEPGPSGPSGASPVAAQGLVASTDTICFQEWIGGAPANPDQVVLTSSGPGEISGLVTSIAYRSGEPAGWLDASLSGTSTPSRLRLQASRGSLDDGTFHADVTVSGPDGATQVVEVSYRVQDPGTMALVTSEPYPGPVIFDVSPGTGTVTGSGFNCRATCTIAVPIGTVMTVQAVPDPNDFFIYWERVGADACLELFQTTCTFTVAGNTRIRPFFALDGYSIILTMEGPGASGEIRIDPFVGGGSPICLMVDGVTMESGSPATDCRRSQPYGMRSTFLTPGFIPPGNEFVGWGGDCTVSGTTCTLSPLPGGTRVATARFRRP